MSLFDRYLAVDWSAHNSAKRGRDSIWIGEWAGGSLATRNLATRSAAMADIASLLAQAVEVGERVLVGFDFAFGYPSGAAALLAGADRWDAVWQLLHDEVSDDDANVSDRFAAAGRINRRAGVGAPHFWGHPWQHRDRYDGLGPRRPAGNHARVAEKRQVERLNGKAQPVWKLSGAGAVGSQSLLGIPRLQELRADPRFAGRIAVWPFETGFSEQLEAPIVIAEIFPSILPVRASPGQVRDEAQVAAIASLFAAADEAGLLRTLLARPALADVEWRTVLGEEGWIVGVGQENLVAQLKGLQ